PFIYEGLRRVAEIKPVVAVMSEAAASGGYITAIAADHIVARGNTLTGSIGVVAEAPNIAGLLESVGVNVTRVKSAPLKAEPGFLTEPVPGAFEAQQRLIDDSYDWFRELVGARRGIEGPALDTVADGRAFTGREALALDLIDELGGETEARSWLETEHSIAKDTELRTRKWGERDLPWPLSMVGLATGDLTPVQLRLGPGPRLYALMY
ncbi:MAG: S49 family peptidase, partial [Pseudomonadota bacterium]